jgi:predicted ferric reductase
MAEITSVASKTSRVRTRPNPRPVLPRAPTEVSRQTIRSPRSPAPHPRVVTTAVVAAAVGFGVTTALAFTATSRHQLAAPGGIAMFLGNLTGLSGTYLALIMVLLVSRIPFVERVLGQDGLLSWHRRIAPWPISLIVAHVVLLTIGYAQAARTGTLHEIGTLVNTFPDMAIATAGFGVMVAVAVASIHAIRRRMRRETWWALHLFMYLALALAFAHEIVLGPSFVGHPLTQLVWSVAWAFTAGLVLLYRFGLPIFRTLRHRLVIDEIRPEAPGVVSIILKGRRLEQLAVSGGQFFEWRFLVPGMWWQAHPFSISARPQPPHLRLTVKCVGDFTTALARLPLGTRVAIEGPYGAFTAYALRYRRVVLIAGGIGVTAVRSLLEDLPKGSRPVVVLRASDERELVLRDEVLELVRYHGGQLHEVLGSRDEVPIEQLAKLVAGDLRKRDTFVAGPEGFVRSVVDMLARLGVPNEAVHAEVYAL